MMAKLVSCGIPTLKYRQKFQRRLDPPGLSPRKRAPADKSTRRDAAVDEGSAMAADSPVSGRQEPPGVDRDGLRSTGANRSKPEQTGAGRSDLDNAAFDRDHSQVSDLRPAFTRDYLAELQGADPDVAIIRGWLESGVELTRDRVLPCSPVVKAYASQWESLVMKDSVVYRKFERPSGDVLFYQLLVPRSMREELLELIHVEAASHLGTRKTAEQGPAKGLLVLLEV